MGQFIIWTYAIIWFNMELCEEIYSTYARRHRVCSLIPISHRSAKSFAVRTTGLHMLCTGTFDLTFSVSVLLPWLHRVPQSVAQCLPHKIWHRGFVPANRTQRSDILSRAHTDYLPWCIWPERITSSCRLHHTSYHPHSVIQSVLQKSTSPIIQNYPSTGSY